MARRYLDQTLDAIRQRMLDATAPGIDKREGAITYDMMSPAASEAAKIYVELDNILELGFADTSNGDYLTMRCSEMGIDRKPAVQATGQLTFTGPVGTSIEVGQRVSTNAKSPIYFVTTSYGMIPAGGSVTVNAQAEVGGVNGNIGVGAITLVIGNLSGTVTVNNTVQFDGGADQESDADLLGRYLERVRKPATSGNANHYLAWAKEVAGVGDARVFPVWNGNGTVKVVIIDSQKTDPPAQLVADVNSHIQSVYPVGVTLTVIGATPVAINVSATLTLKAGKTLADATTEAQAAIAAYLATLAFVDPVVRYNQIGTILLNCDTIVDYTLLKVNGGTTNVSVTAEQVAVGGTVTFT